MRYARFILSSLGLLLGGAILFVSMAAGNNKVLSSSGDYHETSRKQFYLGQILPDHVAYPLLMAVDRIKLDTAAPQDRIYLELDYAQHRFTAANALLDEQKTDLALTTFTKAQKYLLEACVEAQEDNIPQPIKLDTIRAVDFYDQSIDDIRSGFDPEQQSVLDHQTQELKVLRGQLETQITQS